MYHKFFLFAVLVSIIMVSCESKAEQPLQENLSSNTHKVVVKEVAYATKYTYLKVEENDKEHWIAISKKEVNENDVLYYNGGIEMKDFKSKDLDKTFKSIYFVAQISDSPIMESKPATMSAHGNTTSPTNEEIAIDPAKDGVTLADLLSKKDTFSGKSIIVKGKVVKYNSQIMGKNWLHIQDGTKSGDNNSDLTITTNDAVKIGDIVTFEGKITLNKDFGAGYAYDIIMEEATLVKTN